MRYVRHTHRILAVALLALLVMSPSRVGVGQMRTTDGRDVGITIMGAIVQNNDRGSVALIKETGGSVRAVKPGHVIGGKYKVAEVHAKYIVVMKDSERILVYQDKFAKEFRNSGFEPSPDPTPGQRYAMSDRYSEAGFERKSGKVEMTSAYRNKIVTQDMARILMQATAEPYMQNGQIAGFQLSQIDPGSIYDKAGFRDGDVVQVINGRRLTNVAGAVAFLRSLKDENSVDVELMRNGSISKIRVQVSP